jgi:YNFM family putative membrane transporter
VSTTEHPADQPIAIGTPAFWRAIGALILGAVCTCAIMYAVQPILPVFATTFHVSPATSSVALSDTLAVIAGGMLVAGLISEMHGRVPIFLL